MTSKTCFIPTDMDKKDILIELLKKGHINNEEFKLLYDEPVKVVDKVEVPMFEHWWVPFQQPVPFNGWEITCAPNVSTTSITTSN